MLSSAATATAGLRESAHHIDLAIHFTVDFDYEAFVADPCTVYAVTRCLEIISEASRRLPDDLKARHPSIAWKDIAGAGNIYRHDYEDVVEQHVWNTVQIDLPPLRVVIQQELTAINPPASGTGPVMREDGRGATRPRRSVAHSAQRQRSD